jgi:subtilisin family serine protease
MRDRFTAFGEAPVRPVRVLAAVVALAAGALAADNTRAVEPRERLIPGPGGLVRATIERPAATRSRAARLDTGALPESLEIAARVIVDGEADRVRPYLAPGDRLVAGPARGFLVVEAPSVARAVDLARAMMGDRALGSIEVDLEQPRAERFPTDPAFLGQWSLMNFADPAADVNAVPVWDLGVTGLGVTVGVVEFGFQADHPDLAANFNAAASQPPALVSAHATSVAGVIAADNDNGTGGVGVAYDAMISSLAYGLSSDNAAAFLYRNDLNDIKNNSWGPLDNGRITEMSAVERAAIEQGVREGRGGLGEVFVWAAGNGGLDDRVDYDPYASSRFTIAIGAIGDLNRRADYNEVGSSMFAVAHSSGNSRAIFSTTTNGGYTTNFGGTSAAAPLAAGVVALMLDANPALSWRDVQHIIADTAWKVDPDAESWFVNGAGRDMSDDFGFGAVDALAAVNAALSWTPVAPEAVADTGVVAVNRFLPDNDAAGVSVQLFMDEAVLLEAVELVLNVNTDFVGDLHIELRSPAGTRSTLATARVDPGDDFVGHVFTTLRSWGEPSAGVWTLTISDRRAFNNAEWIDARVIGYGTAIEAPCKADLTGDGATTIADVELFLAAYAAGQPIADFTGDGLFDYYDLQAFLNLFAVGCP